MTWVVVVLMGVAVFVWWDYRESAREHERERVERATRWKL